MTGIGGWLRRRRGGTEGHDTATASVATRAQEPAEPAFEARLTIDALGRKCPIPIIMLAERLREVPVGGIIAVLADDPAARPDIPSWCRMKSHDFVREVGLERGWAFLIRRCY